MWEISGYVAFEGGDRMAPCQNVGGDTEGAEGVTFPAEGGDMGVTRSVLRSTVQDPSERARARGEVVALSSVREAPGWKVARVPVSEAEEGLAGAVLALWNERTRQRLASREWLAKVVMRIREHPELDLDDHERIIEAALSDPWWSGAPSISVVYGNATQFERSMEQERAGTPARPARYGRGLSAGQILERYGKGAA